MNKIYIFVILFLILVAVSLTGYDDERGLETMAYVVAVGLDKGETNTLKLSMQFAVLETSGSQNSTQIQKSTTSAVECDSINSGITLLNSYIGKTVNLSHCKAIVISEELAYLRHF